MKFVCCFCNRDQYRIRANNHQIRFECYGHYKNVVECSNCGLVQLYPPWTDEEMEQLYSRYSLKSDFSGYKAKVEIRKYIDKMVSGKKNILEIGCGSGHNLLRQINRGYNAIGIDKDPTVCNGKTILNYDFSDYPKGNSYDFIYSIHVFEHVKKPESFIRMIEQNLLDGGEFAIEIPNIEEPLLTLYHNEAYQNFYWYPFHICYYAPSVVNELFRKYSFKIETERLQRYGIFNHLRWILLGRPGNWNPHIPILDTIYKFVLTKIIKKSDTMLIRGNKQ